ncbi:MAG: ATP-binding cassette domain-containing protein [Actinomycetota bacterium]
MALDGISFQVERGDLFGFLGPNGAGKTATADILTGLSLPASGGATILDHDVVRDSLRVRETTNVIPEFFQRLHRITEWNNLMFTSTLHGVSRREAAARAKGLLHTFDPYEKREVKARSISRARAPQTHHRHGARQPAAGPVRGRTR